MKTTASVILLSFALLGAGFIRAEEVAPKPVSLEIPKFEVKAWDEIAPEAKTFLEKLSVTPVKLDEITPSEWKVPTVKEIEAQLASYKIEGLTTPESVAEFEKVFESLKGIQEFNLEEAIKNIDIETELEGLRPTGFPTLEEAVKNIQTPDLKEFGERMGIEGTSFHIPTAEELDASLRETVHEIQTAAQSLTDYENVDGAAVLADMLKSLDATEVATNIQKAFDGIEPTETIELDAIKGATDPKVVQEAINQMITKLKDMSNVPQ